MDVQFAQPQDHLRAQLYSAHWEPLFAPLPSFSHYFQLKAGPTACSQLSWELNVFQNTQCWPLWEKVFKFLAENTVLTLLPTWICFCAASYKVRGAQWTQELKHQYGNADACYLELHCGTIKLSVHYLSVHYYTLLHLWNRRCWHLAHDGEGRCRAWGQIQKKKEFVL